MYGSIEENRPETKGLEQDHASERDPPGVVIVLPAFTVRYDFRGPCSIARAFEAIRRIPSR